VRVDNLPAGVALLENERRREILFEDCTINRGGLSKNEESVRRFPENPDPQGLDVSAVVFDVTYRIPKTSFRRIDRFRPSPWSNVLNTLVKICVHQAVGVHTAFVVCLRETIVKRQNKILDLDLIIRGRFRLVILLLLATRKSEQSTQQ
jgi:hypothetical protein